jgi:hypothetical protein
VLLFACITLHSAHYVELARCSTLGANDYVLFKPVLYIVSVGFKSMEHSY